MLHEIGNNWWQLNKTTQQKLTKTERVQKQTIYMHAIQQLLLRSRSSSETRGLCEKGSFSTGNNDVHRLQQDAAVFVRFGLPRVFCSYV